MFAGADQPAGRGVEVEVVEVDVVVVVLAAVDPVVEDEPVEALLVEQADRSAVKAKTPISGRTNLRSAGPRTIGTYCTVPKQGATIRASGPSTRDLLVRDGRRPLIRDFATLCRRAPRGRSCWRGTR